ncbi:hypothetical protein QSH57_004579 [Fusarium oxysporum f. sp. vasinfectum]|nr:hypothetical protein QSH57_004579 [Fusarium oxysporum f. sp. vasinfectum]
MTLVHDTILSGMDPELLDLHSCWLDIGTRDYVPDQNRGSDNRVEPFTLLWKSDCHQHLHQRLSAIAPATPLAASHFRSFLLRDIGTYHSRIKATGAVTPGCPRSREPAVIRAKAYNCNKELFSVMYSNYRLFGSGYLPLLALDDEMIDDLSSSSQSRERGTRTQLSRAAILKAWNANKRHLRSVSDPKMLSNYGVRKEVTLRFDIILMMWSNGYFQVTRESHTGPLNRTAPLAGELSLHHLPFWTIPTKETNAILFTQAARFVLPLDHLFFRAGTGFAEQPAQSNVAERYVQSILGFYTAQMLCRLLVHSFIGEKMLHYDQWIWLSRWTVLNRPSRRREELLERQGLGLEDTIMTSGMLWIPSAKMDWQRGHLALDVLVGLYIPRNPLHPRLASQINVQTLTVSKITVDMFFQQWLKEARVAFESNQNQEAEELVERASLSQLKKLQERIINIFYKVPPLIRLQEGMDESATESGQIVTAQTIWEVYAEAWALYAQLYSDTDPDKLPQELPYWMTTRKYLPPHDGWSSFVFRHLFHRPSPPSWNHLYFLRLYRAFKESWETVQQYVGPFDCRFRHVIGDYIMVALNSSQKNEVGTYQHDKFWYHGKPTFFKIQFWAPYFSPPEDNVRIPWQWVRDHKTRHPDIAPDTKSEDMTVEYFHSLERVLCRLWWKCMYETDRLCNTGLARRSLICSSVLEHFSKLVGPRWHAEHGRPYLLPWHLPNWEDRERGREDFLLLPISAGIVLKEYGGTKHFRPTILLPTRHNMMWLLNVVESVPDLCERTQEQIQWMDKVLDNNEGQFALRSHLHAKATATAERDQADPLLRCFLSQTEPPQRVVRSDECAYNTDEGEKNGCFIALDEDGHCDNESSEERRVVLDYGSKKTGSKPASEEDDYYPVFRLDFVSIVGLPRRPICRPSHFFDNITISFRHWSAPYSAKHVQGIDFDLSGRTFRIATGATREAWFIVMHPSQRAAGANNPRRRHDTTHTRTALVQGRALMLASYIKDIFLEGELLGEGVEPRWALGGKETQMIAFDKWVTFQTLFMDGWTGFLERFSVQGDTFWTDHQPAFHAYDYGANINIEVNEGIANLEEETVIRPAYLDGLDDEDDESGDGYEEENSSLLATQQGWGQAGGEEQEGEVDDGLYSRPTVEAEDNDSLFVVDRADNVASQIPPNFSPRRIDTDHRDLDDEADANGHNDGDDNNGDDERERRFLEWMNESENTDVGQHNGTQLQDQEHDQDDGQANSQQQPLSPDTDGSDDVRQRQAPDISPSSLPPSSASVPTTEDQREHDALYSPGLMRLREALEAKYDLDNISHVSYALAVDVHCTAANTYPGTEGRVSRPVCLLADRNRMAGEFYGSNYTFYPLGFHPTYGNFTSDRPPAFLDSDLFTVMKENMTKQSSLARNLDTISSECSKTRHSRWRERETDSGVSYTGYGNLDGYPSAY